MRATTELSLADQMRFTPQEIERRKKLFDITEEDCQCLKRLQPKIIPYLDYIVDQFYNQQTGNPEINLIIGDTETLRRLKVAMRNYVEGAFSGNYDCQYVESRLRAGKIHKRIGVTPKLYMSAMSHLQIILQESVKKICEVDGEYAKKAIQKILLFDSQLVFDTYISSLTSEIELAKEEVEKYARELEERVVERTKQLEFLSKTDPLTNLLNQRGLQDALKQMIAAARRSQSIFSLLYFDLNNFKMANDTLGHAGGDMILCKVSDAIRTSIREVDFACRYGGDEFCIILPNMKLDEIENVAKRIISACSPYDQFTIAFSFGALQSDESKPMDIREILDIVDQRMYQAKHKARQSPGHWISLGHTIHPLSLTLDH